MSRVTIELPNGFRVERTERANSAGDERASFAVYEEGVVWPESGEPRAVVEVTLNRWSPDWDFDNRGPEVSWPSTSDKRPELAQALAVALAMAAEEAQS